MLIDNGCKSRIAGAGDGGGWVGCDTFVGFGVGAGVGVCVGIAVGVGTSVGAEVTALACPVAVVPQEASTMMNKTQQSITALLLLCANF